MATYLLYQTHFSERSRSARTHWSKSDTVGIPSVGDTSPFTVILSTCVLLGVRSVNPVRAHRCVVPGTSVIGFQVNRLLLNGAKHMIRYVSEYMMYSSLCMFPLVISAKSHHVEACSERIDYRMATQRGGVVCGACVCVCVCVCARSLRAVVGLDLCPFGVRKFACTHRKQLER